MERSTILSNKTLMHINEHQVYIYIYKKVRIYVSSIFMVGVNTYNCMHFAVEILTVHITPRII